MTGFVRGESSDPECEDVEDRWRAIRTLLIALGLTPTLLVPYTTGSFGPVTTGSALTAIPLGAVAGLVTSLVVDRVDLRHVNDAVALVGMLALAAVAVVVVWLVVPPGATPSFAVGCVAFVWALALGGVARHVVWPRFAANAG
ncbi:hypothetical protein [Halosimplex halobium]|uniref:hypothetical protein n=1 Tax=Halosimplex halobium TaxID=3396618 RepID=UPI003F56B0DE